MSTYWYFECVSHTPALRSDDEFTQHTEDDAFHAAVALAQARPLEVPPDEWWYDDELWHSSYFERNARRFLQLHPECDLELVNEYGDRRPLSPGSGRES